MRLFRLFLLCLCVAGCNSIYMKPGTLDTNKLIYTPRGGHSMQRSLKETFDKRGYKTHVGKLSAVRERTSSDLETYSQSKDIRYSVIIDEKTSILRPVWCMFNGFWWWNFSLAISDRNTGTEILSWRGRGCQNSSLRKLNSVLDKLEMKEPVPVEKTKAHKKSGNKQNLIVIAPKRNDKNLLIFAK